MEWSLLFFLLVAVGLPFSLLWWGLWQITQNWSGPRGYRARIDELRAGKPGFKKAEKKVGQEVRQFFVLDTDGNRIPDDVKGMKDILKEKGHIIFIMIIASLLVLFFLPVLGDFWVSALFGLAVGMFPAWILKSITWKRGLMIAGVVCLLSLISSAFIRAPLYIGAILFLLLGPVTFLVEERTKKNVFPWWMMDICLFMAVFNILLGAIYLFGVDLSAFIPDVSWGNGLAGDLYGQAVRVTTTGSAWLDALKWIVALQLIIIVGGPHELAEKIKKVQEEKKKSPAGGGGITTTRFLIYDLMVEWFLSFLGRRKKGERKETEAKPEKKTDNKK